MIKKGLVLSALVVISAVVMASTSLAKTTTTVAAQRCTVVMYLTVPAPAAQVRALKARLIRDERVVAFRFVTRAQALEQLRKRAPELVANLKSNPLPASLRIQLKDGADAERVATRYRSLKRQLRVVDEIMVVKASSTSCSPR